MATELSWNKRLWRGIVSHKPLKRHIDWWLRGLAICAVPLIVVCTIVIGAELAAPDWFKTGTGLLVANLTEDLLNAAIEGSMLGCIALSKQAHKDGNKKQAYTMTGLGWLFAGLTVVTVGFRVFHASPDAGTVLLWIRCGAGIAFCYLSHLFDDDDAEEVTPLQHRTLMEQLTATFNKQIEQLTAELSKLQSDLESKTAELSRTQESLRSTLHDGSILKATMSEKELSLQAKMQATIQSARDEMKAQMKASHQTDLQAMQAKIDALARVNMELKAQVKEQAKAPVKPVKQVSSEKFDTRAFVYSCLRKNPEMKLSEMVKEAKMKGQELSEPTLSRYRKDFRESSSESSVV